MNIFQSILYSNMNFENIEQIIDYMETIFKLEK